MTETIAVLRSQWPKGEPVHTSAKFDHWIECGSAGGNCRDSSVVETAVIDHPHQRREHHERQREQQEVPGARPAPARRVRSASSGSGSTSDGESWCAVVIGQRSPCESRRPIVSWITVMTRIARNSANAMADA